MTLRAIMTMPSGGTPFRSLTVAIAVLMQAQAFAAPAAGAFESASTEDCLHELQALQVEFERVPPLPALNIPIAVKERIGPLQLVPRGRKRAVMDCSLALALHQAAPIFFELGLTRLTFSAAHDHRTRRGSAQLSSHAFGTAIDVHSFDGPAGLHDVARDFEKHVGVWQHIAPTEGALQSCVGAASTPAGRNLPTLACRLKLETSFRIVVTLDDNDDHRDHFHL